MKLAEKFGLPVFTFVDTPGAYPGIGAEERGQSEAIGRNIFEMAQLEVPIITTIIGEGGSGGALAISVADQVLMLQYSVYSVISPEGCASILWKTAERASDAADALGITAHRLKALGVIDKIVSEPVGGAHRDTKQMAREPEARAERCAAPGAGPEARRNCCSGATSGCSPTAASATPRSAECAGPAGTAGRDSGSRIAVAVSGGRDSTALWHATGPRGRAAAALQVVALHVHHGLQPEADDWVAHLQRQARRWAAGGLPVSLQWRRLQGAPGRGRQHRGLGAARTLCRAGRHGPRLRCRRRAAGPPPPRPGRDLPAAGAARRRAGRTGGHAARGAARRHRLGPALAGAAAASHRRLCAAASAELRRRPEQRRPFAGAQPIAPRGLAARWRRASSRPRPAWRPARGALRRRPRACANWRPSMRSGPARNPA